MIQDVSYGFMGKPDPFPYLFVDIELGYVIPVLSQVSHNLVVRPMDGIVTQYRVVPSHRLASHSLTYL